MKTHRVLLATLLLVTVAPVRAQESNVNVYAFESDTQPPAVVVRVAYADIEIVGSARDDVAIATESLVQAESETEARMAALTTIVAPVIAGNTIRLESPRNTHRVRLRLEVPNATSLEVWGSNGGRVVVRNVSGQITIENSNAGVTLEGVSGSAVVHASNGSIVGEFLSVTPDVPMSFATSNGVIDLTFPADLRADVVMETDNAGFTSDFVIEPADADRGRPLPPDRRRVTGRINAGGPLFRFQTENAAIVLRRAE